MTAKFDFRTLETGYAADWPVKVQVPVDGGTFETREFSARFRSLTADEQAGLERDHADLSDRLEQTLRLGFVDLGKAEGDKLTPELFGKLWGDERVRLALIQAYGEFRRGAPAKN